MSEQCKEKGSSEVSGSTIPAGVPVRLAELVSYADGSIVSKTITKSQAGTLTLFAFDQGQGLSEHSAPFDAYIEVLDGTGHITVGGNEVAASMGQTVMMPANIPHAVQAKEKFKMLLIMIRG